MTPFLVNYIKSNPNIYRYLRDNSYWYKYLNRDEGLIKELEKNMNEDYKLRVEDKINNISKSLELINTFMDVLK